MELLQRCNPGFKRKKKKRKNSKNENYYNNKQNLKLYALQTLKKNNKKKKEYPQILLKDKNKNGTKSKGTRKEIRNQTHNKRYIFINYCFG